MKNPIKSLSPAERVLWGLSVTVILLSFFLSGGGNVLTVTASLIGVTALIFVAKGMVLGQVLTVVFAVFYGIISIYFRYYGEMITYLFMTSPIAVATVVQWIKHPYENSGTVEVNRLTKRQCAVMWISAAVITGGFYFILRALGNANLFFSTVSVATSFIASYLTLFRSSFYAVGYAANDVVLIILWTMATVSDISYLPMIICFIMFLMNDLYGFYNWQKMKKSQSANGR